MGQKRSFKVEIWISFIDIKMSIFWRWTKHITSIFHVLQHNFHINPLKVCFFFIFMTNSYKLSINRISGPGSEFFHKWKNIQQREMKKSCFMTFSQLLVKKPRYSGWKAKRDYLFTTKSIALHLLGPPRISRIKWKVYDRSL